MSQLKVLWLTGLSKFNFGKCSPDARKVSDPWRCLRLALNIGTAVLIPGLTQTLISHSKEAV